MQPSARVVLVVALFAIRASAVQAPPSPFAALSAQADSARDANQLEKAVDLYKKALKLKPNWEDGLWSLGSIAYDLNQYKDCIWAFGKLSELKPDSAPGWSMAGLCEFELRNYGSALDDLAHAEHLEVKENAELGRAARLHYALVLSKTGTFEKAINILSDLAREKKMPDIVVAAGIAGLRRPWLPSEVPEPDRDLVYRLGEAMAFGMAQDYKLADQKFDE